MKSKFFFSRESNPIFYFSGVSPTTRGVCTTGEEIFGNSKALKLFYFFATSPSPGTIWHFWKILALQFPTPEEREILRIWRTFRGFVGIFEDWFFEDLTAFKSLIPQSWVCLFCLSGQVISSQEYRCRNTSNVLIFSIPWPGPIYLHVAFW